MQVSDNNVFQTLSKRLLDSEKNAKDLQEKLFAEQKKRRAIEQELFSAKMESSNWRRKALNQGSEE